MRKMIGAFAGLVFLIHADGAWAATVGGGQFTCSRQAAIWQHLFQENSDVLPSPACREVSDWFGEPRALEARGASDAPSASTIASQASAAGQIARPLAVEYSHAYEVRRKIHYYASFATIPLFVTQYILGDKLFDDDDPGGSTKSAHSAAAVGIEALFGVNTVTGVWNMWEARKDPNGRAKRLTHGLMMLGADVGFVATGLLAPDDDNGDRSGRTTHRNVALASMSVATVSYLIMLFGR